MPFARSAGSRVANTVYAVDEPAPVMKRLVPDRRNPSPRGTYWVFIATASEPLPGSVRQ